MALPEEPDIQELFNARDREGLFGALTFPCNWRIRGEAADALKRLARVSLAGLLNPG